MKIFIKHGLITLFATLLFVFSAQANNGQEKGDAFSRHCAACHSLVRGRNNFGPYLTDVIGRKSGTANSYRYSQGYIDAGEKGLIWTAENLNNFLADPTEFLKEFLDIGTIQQRMPIRIRDAKDRADVISYLISVNSE